MNIQNSLWSIWPSTASSLYAINSQSDSPFWTSSAGSTNAVIAGSRSNSLYFMYDIIVSIQHYAVIRKLYHYDTLAWMVSLLAQPIQKCFTIDLNEQTVYVGFFEFPIVITQISTNDGSIVSTQS